MGWLSAEGQRVGMLLARPGTQDGCEVPRPLVAGGCATLVGPE